MFIRPVQRLKHVGACGAFCKIYRVINDEEAKGSGLIRIIDESSEDYAFSSSRFHPIEVPKPVEKVLLNQ